MIQKIMTLQYTVIVQLVIGHLMVQQLQKYGIGNIHNVIDQSSNGSMKANNSLIKMEKIQTKFILIANCGSNCLMTVNNQFTERL